MMSPRYTKSLSTGVAMLDLHFDTVSDKSIFLYQSCFNIYCIVKMADEGISLCDNSGSECNHQCNNNRFLWHLLVVFSEKLQAILGEVLQAQLLTNDGEVLGRY